MKLIRYLGPAHVLVTMDGTRVLRGDTVEVSDQEADFMAHSPHTWIDVLGSSAPRRRNSKPEADSGEGQDNTPGESPGEQEE